MTTYSLINEQRKYIETELESLRFKPKREQSYRELKIKLAILRLDKECK